MWKRTIVTAVAMLTALSLAASAQERSGLRISPSLGVGFYPNDVEVAREEGQLLTIEFQSAIAEGFEFGYRVSDRWGVEIDFVHSIPDVELVSGPVSVQVDDERTIALTGNLNYYFPVPGRWTPFVSGGLGVMLRQEDQSDQDFAGTLGGGVVYRLASWLDLRGTIRDYISSFDRFEGRPDIDSSLVNEVFLTVGLDVYP